MNYIFWIVIYGLAFSIGITRTYRWIKSLDGAKQRKFASKMSIFAYTILAASFIVINLTPVSGAVPGIALLVFVIAVYLYIVNKIKKMNGAD